jgi:hypothetical protein
MVFKAAFEKLMVRDDNPYYGHGAKCWECVELFRCNHVADRGNVSIRNRRNKQVASVELGDRLLLFANGFNRFYVASIYIYKN